jgi:hypothetical protein
MHNIPVEHCENKISVVWNMMLRSWTEVYRRFRETCFLCQQGLKCLYIYNIQKGHQIPPVLSAM